MNLINKGDFLELLTKGKQRGTSYFISKITLNEKKRTKSTFSLPDIESSNWWIIPEMKQRENEKISGSVDKTFDRHLTENYCQGKKNLKLLSVACGVGNREIRLAESGHFNEVLGIDLSPDFINDANKKVAEKKLQNISFKQADFYSFPLEADYYDVILFHSALHHFKNIEQVAQRVIVAIKDDGLLVLNEYVGKNRLQFTSRQLSLMNKLLTHIPENYRRRYLTNVIKKKVYAPGLLRMVVSDPSEAVESETIMPVIHKYFKTVEEKKTGGDLLMMVLKDISHHFVNSDDQKGKQILKKLFEEEDQYLLDTEDADFIFGVYQKK
jgi:ubiquinone/menaquinone biosynthesis C-methylase UbiE